MVDHVGSKLGLITQQHVLMVVAVIAVVIITRSSSTVDAGRHCGHRCGGCWTDKGSCSGLFSGTGGWVGGKDLRLGQ